MKKVLLIVIAVCLVAIVGLMTWMFVVQSKRYADVPYTPEQREALVEICAATGEDLADLPALTKAEWKAKVNHAIGYSAYVETSNGALLRDDGGRYVGRCYPMLVVVDGGLAGAAYAAVLLHELVHLVYWYTDERQTEFTAFRLAYESTDPYMKLAANTILFGSLQRPANDKYNITGRAIRYLHIGGGEC